MNIRMLRKELLKRLIDSFFHKKIKNFFIYTFQDLLIYLGTVIDISNEKKPIIGIPFLSSNLG